MRAFFAAALAFLAAGCFDVHGIGVDSGPVDAIAPLGECEIAQGIFACNTGTDCGCPDDPDHSYLCFLQPVPPGPPGGACLANEARFCNDLRCGAGEVCTFGLRQQMEESVLAAVCVQPADCIAAREGLGLPVASGCYYGDATSARSGVIPPVSCDDRAAPSICGEGCPCPDGACELTSEDHPWGLCHSAIVFFDGCSGCPEACMHIVAPADVSATFPRYAERTACVRADACAALSALYPDTYRCGE